MQEMLKWSIFSVILKHQPLSHDYTHFVNVLKVKPGIEWSDGQIQIWQLEICYSSTYIPLIGVDAKSSKTQTVFLQSGQVHGDGVVLVKNHSECVCLDLWEAEHKCAVMQKKLINKKSLLQGESPAGSGRKIKEFNYATVGKREISAI